MTNNTVGRSGNFTTVVYDSGHGIPNERKRIGISATEIELLNDIPPSSGRPLTNSENTTRGFGAQIPASSTTKQNNYQTLSVNRKQSKPNVIYHDGTDQQLNSALNQLLEKYAPDAIPQNLIYTSNNNRASAQINVVTTRDQPTVSAFQTTVSPSSAVPHNYSTIIRPINGQMPSARTQMNNNNNNNNNGVRNEQTPAHSRPAKSYDSFQHVVPPVQQHQSQRTVPINTTNGHSAQVVPGKLYNLDDDPLHLLYDRQPPTVIHPPQPNFGTTFQPSNNFQPPPNLSNVIYANTTQRYPQQPIPISTNPNVNGLQQFDLGDLIKRVQQDYLREIQPFVSSVKFVEKDREYGQSIADVGFVTPVTVRKGFRSQADDILRRSFGRQDRRGPPPTNEDEDNTYSEDDDDDDDDDDDSINDLRPANHRRRSLEKIDSKQSFTSVTSVSTVDSDFDEHYRPIKNWKNKAPVHNQSTSPPPQVNQTKPPPTQVQKPGTAPLNVTPKLNTKDDSDEEETSTRNFPAVVVKPAQRLPSDGVSDTDSESTVSDGQPKPSTTYNEHELSPKTLPNAPTTRSVLASIVPTYKLNEVIGEGVNSTPNQGALRSEDIHPTPPTIRPGQPTPTTINRSQLVSLSDTSDGTQSGLDDNAGSDSEGQSKGYKGQSPASSTVRPGVPSAPFTARNPSTPTATTTQNPFSTPGTNSNNSARLPTGGGTNPNIPPDQRSNITDRPSASVLPTGNTRTGSNRLFQSDNAPKPGGKQGPKSGPSSIGDRIKSIFRRR